MKKYYKNKLALFLMLCFILLSINTKAQTAVQLKGKVSDNQGHPLAGVSVVIKGTTKGTLTDAVGNYTLNMPPNHKSLIFSFIGYTREEVKTNGKKILNVTLNDNQKMLNDVVVVGYGVQKKVNLTGAVSTINFADQSNSRPITSVSSALAGLSAGLQVRQSSGAPGSDGASLLIRGAGTLNSTAPLVLIDGMQGSMDEVNAQDIESLSVLKDAAASAIYGAQAANGVILITTKKGKAGKLNISYSGRVSYAQPTRLIKMVSNYADYMDLYNESRTNFGESPVFNQTTIDTWRQKSAHPNELNAMGVPNYVAYPNTDWEKVLFKHGIINKHDITISGGSDKYMFMASGGFLDNPGLVDNTGIKQYNVRSNLEVKFTKWLSAGLRLYGGMTNADPGNFSNANTYFRGTTPGVYPKWNGRYGDREANEESPNANNLLSKLNSSDGRNQKSHLNTTFYTKINLCKGLEWDFNFNYNRHWNNSRTWAISQGAVQFSTGKETTKPADPENLTTSFQNDDSYTYTLENILHYNTTINKVHDIGILGGYQEYYNYTQTNQATKKGLIDPSITIPSSATIMQSISGTASDWATRSFFGRFNYDYKSRYLFEADVREDGSSRFQKDRRWGLFPSMSAGWRISEESFMQKTRNFLDNLKLRASWGMLGNSSIGNYEYEATYDAEGYAIGNTQVQGLAITSLANNELRWESTAMTNIGLDANFLNNRLSLTIEAYDKLTNGILCKPDIPLTMGNKTAPYVNIANVDNKGLEMTLGWNDRIGNLNYSVTGNFSYNRNMVTKYKGEFRAGWTTDDHGNPLYVSNIGEVSTGGTSRTVEGKMIGEYYLLKPYNGSGQYFNKDGSVNKNGGPKDGMIRTKADMKWLEAMQKAGYHFNPNSSIKPGNIWYGDYIYADTNNDGIYGNSYDNTFQGVSGQPKFNYGMQIAAQWKGFDFSMFLSAATGFDIYDPADVAYNSTETDYGFGIAKRIADNHYFYNPDQPNDPRTNINAKYPRLTFGAHSSQNSAASTLFMFKGDYMKLKNLTIGYTLPKKIMKAGYIKSARIYLSGENLWTLTAYPGQDPEMASTGQGYATLRQFAFGVNLTF